MNNTDLYLEGKFIAMDIGSIRKNKNLTQRQLSELADVSIPTIIRIEKGEDGYKLDSLLKIIDALGYELYIKKRDDKDVAKETDKGFFTTNH